MFGEKYLYSCTTTEMITTNDNIMDKRCLQIGSVGTEDYFDDIVEYYSQIELNGPPSGFMFHAQPELSWLTRESLINYLIECHEYLNLAQESLFMACTIADSYCAKKIVHKKHYQLLILTCLWIASKHSDNKCLVPTAYQLCQLSDNTYKISMFSKMERYILKALNWNLTENLNCFEVLKLCYPIQDSLDMNTLQNSEIFRLGQFFCELSLIGEEYTHFESSIKAISGMLISCTILEDYCFTKFVWKCITEQKCRAPFLSMNKETIDDLRKCNSVFLNDLYQFDSMKLSCLVRKHFNNNLRYKVEKFLFESLDVYLQVCDLTNMVIVNPQNKHLMSKINMLLDNLIGFEPFDYKNLREYADFDKSNDIFNNIFNTPEIDVDDYSLQSHNYNSPISENEFIPSTPNSLVSDVNISIFSYESEPEFWDDKY